MYKLCPFKTKEDAIHFATEEFINLSQEAIEAKGRFTVALSGGSTPKVLYKELTSQKNLERLCWEKIFLFFSDERAVDENDPQSNYKMAIDAGFHQIRDLNIFRLKGEKELEISAKEYEELILREVVDGRFDLILLGMGDDGHTASLFPYTKGLEVTDRLVIPNFIEEKDVWRLTFTYPCIEKAKTVLIPILGEEKQETLTRVLEGPFDFKRLPLQKVILEREGKTLIITSP
jgi:6-phosphogluconolactonase